MSEVLKKLDLNNDGYVSPEELEKVGLDGLPNFDNMGAEGHHYDVESGTLRIIFFEALSNTHTLSSLRRILFAPRRFLSSPLPNYCGF